MLVKISNVGRTRAEPSLPLQALWLLTHLGLFPGT